MLNGIQNFLKFINDNWTSIIVIISLIIAIVQKAKSYFTKSKQEKVDAAKAQITMKLITDAEIDYSTWEKAGSIKRAQVIQKIFTEYPVLSKVADQQEIVDFIDETINDALKELRKIVAENKSTEETTKEE